MVRPASISEAMRRDPSAREYVEQIERAAGDDFRVNRIGASHAVDPSTSRDAAILNLPRSGSQREAVLRKLVEFGARGATFEELQTATGIESAAKRLTELKAGGWAFATGTTRPTHTGSPASVHMVSEKALHELERERRENFKAAGEARAGSQPAGVTTSAACLASSSADHDDPVSLFGDEPATRRSTSHYADVEAA